jgi:hypothetical protein
MKLSAQATPPSATGPVTLSAWANGVQKLFQPRYYYKTKSHSTRSLAVVYLFLMATDLQPIGRGFSSHRGRIKSKTRRKHETAGHHPSAVAARRRGYFCHVRFL